MTDRGLLNVTDFGALGDGKSDDTRAIQTALDDAGRMQSTVLVPPGVFLCGSQSPLPEEPNQRKELARKLRDYLGQR